MNKYINTLQVCPLFQEIKSDDISGLLTCLGAVVRKFPKNQHILSEGDPATLVGILLSGGASIVNRDIYGNRNIVSQVNPGELFGESFACSDTKTLPVSVEATTDSEVMLMDCHRITTSCSNACRFHNQMIYNLLQIVATRNLEFHKKLEILSKRTTRDKLIAYLLSEAKRAGSDSFTIPYDRQGLADYLGVERSAMSNELGKLQREGILKTYRSHFTIYKDARS